MRYFIKVLFLSLYLLASNHLLLGQQNKDLVKNLLLSNDLIPDQTAHQKDKFQMQILYTQIDRDKDNQPHFTSYPFNLDTTHYFYPASAIKIFAAALALEKINKLDIKGLDKNTYLTIDSSYSRQTSVSADLTAPGLKPSIAHYIKKLLIVSDNDAFNRLYEFIGQEAFNSDLIEKNFMHTRITHRLSVNLNKDENQHTNGFTFFDKDAMIIYKQAPEVSSKDFTSAASIFLGKAYFDGEKIIQSPMDFKNKNYSALEDLQKVLKTILFPESFDRQAQFDLTAADYQFLYQYMSQLPRETKFPDLSDKADNYCKFFMFGDKNTTQIPSNIRIFNKIGNAYGFTIDNAYIVDFDKGIEFLLTAVIYTNENETLNDGNYEYDTIALPFFGNLGRIIYDYELKRKRAYKPDLKKFDINYDH
ncbi:MAG: class A beta-lactamase-related serine hydrolase [Flavobacteriaceae bacterium]|nr:class A beta-lactamase-related serine hydrolase [Flavobacteriaceae bacterium]